ncbi:MAG: YitT family protein [Tyzzerella sp.]|nr:YitT family protein [Tyzzerella sp.]
MDKKAFLREYGYITAGIFIVALAVYFFLMPSNVVVGSLAGLIMVVAEFVPLKISVLTFIANAILLTIGFILVGKEFGAKTVYCSVLMSVYLAVFEIIFPNFQSLTNDQFLDALCYLLVVSVGLAMLFNVNASSGGLDIVAKLMNKFLHIEMGKAMAISGMVTAATSILVYDSKSLVLSFLATYANGIVIDSFIDGFNRRKRVCILSTEHEKIRQYIVNELKQGVTVYKAYGGYNKEEKVELITIVDRNSYAQLLEYLHSVDSKVFVTVSTVNEVIGYWNIQRKLGS